MPIFGAAFVSCLGETEPFHCVRDGEMVCAGIKM